MRIAPAIIPQQQYRTYTQVELLTLTTTAGKRHIPPDALEAHLKSINLPSNWSTPPTEKQRFPFQVEGRAKLLESFWETMSTTRGKPGGRTAAVIGLFGQSGIGKVNPISLPYCFFFPPFNF